MLSTAPDIESVWTDLAIYFTEHKIIQLNNSNIRDAAII